MREMLAAGCIHGGRPRVSVWRELGHECRWGRRCWPWGAFMEAGRGCLYGGSLAMSAGTGGDVSRTVHVWSLAEGKGKTCWL